MTASQIEAAIAHTGISPLPPKALEQLQIHFELLLKWNARLNLSAIRSPEEILQRHFLESLFAAQYIPDEVKTLLDFGSGGGFPGLPIAVARPNIHITLGESQAKKASFLREVARTAAVPNIDVFQGRLEGLSRTYDAVALRAVDKMLLACRTAAQKLVTGGRLIVFSTIEEAENLVKALPNIAWTEPLTLPHATQRILLVGKAG
ncbi:MAG TPA: 16S rRNA (guanine(527)-N(7))-methyltransferase RsmG [Alloacidobacterium sp.]|nr:16S rRNA (guanine(527)-N(7))-methyltransferase RsmG [Alloacidobacterium sp.]